MESVNLGLCNKCYERVPSQFFTRNEQTWITKDCPKCGVTESLVSTDAKVWQEKREMANYKPDEHAGCTLKCIQCKVDHKPNMVFLDVTNRCNMNCPICIATIKEMGFDFNPPLSYFDKIFAELGKMNPQPVVNLFGGEPTVREDILDIIALGRKHGLKPHITTNGVRLADEEFCKKICDARVPVRLAFDGRSPEIYEKLRNNRGAYDKKMKALENLKKYSKRKHTIISCAAYGINDQHIADMFQYIHDNRDLISDIGIIPLTENWKEGDFDAAKHTTMEDVEKMVQQAVPGGDVEFVPAGLSYAMKKPRSFFRQNPRSEVLLLAGVHPNCESITLLVSDGKGYRSINHYLKKGFRQAFLEFVEISKKLDPKLSKLDRDKFFQRLRGQLLLIATLGPWVLKTLRLGRAMRGTIRDTVSRMFSRKGPNTSSSRRPRRILRVAMLPFEEQHSIDAKRLKDCKAVFAYEDTEDGKVKYAPACLWYPYRNPLLENLSRKYGVACRNGEIQPYRNLRKDAGTYESQQANVNAQ